MLQKLQFRPGVNREVSNYSNEGGWYKSDKIRFKAGFPEQIGGWTRVSANQYAGTARNLISWVAIIGAVIKLSSNINTAFFLISSYISFC